MGRACSVAVMIGLALGGPCSSGEEPGSCDARGVLEDGLLRTGTSDRMAVAAYDHVGGQWTFFWCGKKGECKETLSRPFELELNGVPLLELGSRDRHLVAVYDTNTLLFELTGLKATETEREDVAVLKEFASLFASGLGALLRVPKPPAGARAALLGPRAAEDPEKILLASLDAARDADFPTVEELERALKEVDAWRQTVEDRFDRAFGYVQAVEQGVRVDAPSAVPVKELDESLARLAAARRKLSLGSRDCAEPVGWLSEALALHVEPAPPAALQERTERFVELVWSLRNDHLALGNAGCSSGQAGALGALAGSIENGPPTTAGAPAPEVARWTRLRVALGKHLLWVGSLDLAAKAAESADAILAAQKTILQTAARINQLVTRIGGQPGFCRQAHGFLVVNEPSVPLAWDKDRTFDFNLKATGPFAADVIRSHGDDLALSYRLRQRRWTFDLGFGVIWAFGDEARDPTWAAVTDPQDPDRKVIARTLDASRSGAPVATLILQPPGSARTRLAPGLDLGVGLDPDRLFVAVGASVKLAPFARLGAAWAFHRVKVLAEPQTELVVRDGVPEPRSVTFVTSSDDIQTRDELKKGFYLSLVITLKGFNPFKGD